MMKRIFSSSTTKSSRKQTSYHTTTIIMLLFASVLLLLSLLLFSAGSSQNGASSSSFITFANAQNNYPTYTRPPKPTPKPRTLTQTVSPDPPQTPPPRRHRIIFLPPAIGEITVIAAGVSASIAAIVGPYPLLPLQASRLLLLFEMVNCGSSLIDIPGGLPFPIAAFPGLHVELRGKPTHVDYLRGAIISNLSFMIASTALIMFFGLFVNLANQKLAEQEDGGPAWKAATAVMFPSSMVVLNSLFLGGTIFCSCSILIVSDELHLDLPIAIASFCFVTAMLVFSARAVRRNLFIDRTVKGYSAGADVQENRERCLGQIVRSSVAGTLFYGKSVWHGGGRGSRSTPMNVLFNREGAKLPPSARRFALLFRSFRPPKAGTSATSTFGLVSDSETLFVAHYYYFECFMTISFAVIQSVFHSSCVASTWGMFGVTLLCFLVSMYVRPHIVPLVQVLTDCVLGLTTFGYLFVGLEHIETTLSRDTLRSISDTFALLGIAILLFASIVSVFSTFAFWFSGGKMLPDHNQALYYSATNTPLARGQYSGDRSMPLLHQVGNHRSGSGGGGGSGNRGSSSQLLFNVANNRPPGSSRTTTNRTTVAVNLVAPLVSHENSDLLGSNNNNNINNNSGGGSLSRNNYPSDELLLGGDISSTETSGVAAGNSSIVGAGTSLDHFLSDKLKEGNKFLFSPTKSYTNYQSNPTASSSGNNNNNKFKAMSRNNYQPPATVTLGGSFSSPGNNNNNNNNNSTSSVVAIPSTNVSSSSKRSAVQNNNKSKNSRNNNNNVNDDDDDEDIGSLGSLSDADDEIDVDLNVDEDIVENGNNHRHDSDFSPPSENPLHSRNVGGAPKTSSKNSSRRHSRRGSSSLQQSQSQSQQQKQKQIDNNNSNENENATATAATRPRSGTQKMSAAEHRRLLKRVHQKMDEEEEDEDHNGNNLREEDQVVVPVPVTDQHQHPSQNVKSTSNNNTRVKSSNTEQPKTSSASASSSKSAPVPVGSGNDRNVFAATNQQPSSKPTAADAKSFDFGGALSSPLNSRSNSAILDPSTAKNNNSNNNSRSTSLESSIMMNTSSGSNQLLQNSTATSKNHLPSSSSSSKNNNNNNNNDGGGGADSNHFVAQLPAEKHSTSHWKEADPSTHDRSSSLQPAMDELKLEESINQFPTNVVNSQNNQSNNGQHQHQQAKSSSKKKSSKTKYEDSFATVKSQPSSSSNDSSDSSRRSSNNNDDDEYDDDSPPPPPSRRRNGGGTAEGSYLHNNSDQTPPPSALVGNDGKKKKKKMGPPGQSSSSDSSSSSPSSSEKKKNNPLLKQQQPPSSYI